MPLSSLYSTVPSLQSVRLRSFHLNWRGPTLTMRIDLPRFPDRPAAEWTGVDHDTLQIHLQFLAVHDLCTDGWIPGNLVDISLAPLDERRLLTSIVAERINFSFTASDTLTIGHISAFRGTKDGSDEGRHAFLSPLDAHRFTSVPNTYESTFYERI
ncbi:Imm50 family immunity protein [Streptomyces sp. NPDC060209]|uniref:Imm50 family immunity protein n=1 Tax=Streptomyces sp. NPDC060209 TaxID=3347073 RepID=UPI00364E58C6